MVAALLNKKCIIPNSQDLDNNVMVITPEKFLVFESNEDALEASIQISNISSQEIVYKVITGIAK